MIPTLLLLLLSAGFLMGQTDGTPVQMNPLPFYRPSVQFLYYDGSSKLEYVCQANSEATTIQLTVSGATAAAPGEFTVADHGWYRASSVFDTGGYTPKVTIAGGTGNWAAVNGSWSVLPTSTTTFRIQKTDGTQLSTSGFGAVTGTITVTSKAPRLNDYHWWIRKFVRDGSGNLLSVLYGWGAVLGAGRARCDERTTAGKVEWR